MRAVTLKRGGGGMRWNLKDEVEVADIDEEERKGGERLMKS